MVRSVREAIAELMRDPSRTVLAELEGLVVELRLPAHRSADDVFQEVGPWEGESATELVCLLREARAQGGSKDRSPF